MPAPDTMLLDFSDSERPFGPAGAVRIANTFPDSSLRLCQWGAVAAPTFTPFSGGP